MQRQSRVPSRPLHSLISALVVWSCAARGLEHRDGTARTLQQRDVCQEPFPNIPLNYQPQDKVLALTFDDGPEAQGLPAILDVLKRHNVPATFFVNTYRESSWLQPFNSPANQAAVKRAVAEGHEVGSHAALHLRLSELPPAEARSQVLWAIANISAVTGRPVTLFRAPYGDGFMGPLLLPGMAPPALLQLWDAVRQHHVHVAWSFSGEDYKIVGSPQGCVERVVAAYGPPLAQAGVTGVVLMHSTPNAMGGCPAALDKLIPYWRSHGYGFVTVRQLVQQRYGASPEEVVRQAQRCPSRAVHAAPRTAAAAATAAGAPPAAVVVVPVAARAVGLAPSSAVTAAVPAATMAWLLAPPAGRP